jgi:hypothetical protein
MARLKGARPWQAAIRRKMSIAFPSAKLRGFARVSVTDSKGASDAVTVRLE